MPNLLVDLCFQWIFIVPSAWDSLAQQLGWLDAQLLLTPSATAEMFLFHTQTNIAPFLKLFAKIIFVLKESLDMQLKSLFLSSQLLRDCEFLPASIGQVSLYLAL